MSPHRVAAVAYAVYGVVYLGGGVARLTPERMVTFFGFVPWWFFFVAGGALLLVLPPLLWRGEGTRWGRWLARLLALGPAGKALSLFWKQGRVAAAGDTMSVYNWFFAAVAVVTAILLARAGFSRTR